MNILYISQSRKSDKPYLDPSVRYRCFNPAESLSSLGFIVDVTTIDMATKALLERYDLIAFHRPAISKKLEQLISTANKLKKITFADYDDLIFNPDYAELSPGFLNNQYSLQSVTASFQRNYEALALFDHFSVSTDPLLDEIKKIKPTASTCALYNYLSREWLQHNASPMPKQSERRRITYLPGTNSHHHDFAAIESALSSYLYQNRNIILRIVGPLKFSQKLFNSSQLDLLSYIPYPQLPKVIKDSWITIAPLAYTLFNNCKSGLKYLESAAFGVPVVASPIHDMQRLDSKALLLPKTTPEWIDSFEKLSDEKYYKECSEVAISHIHNVNRETEHLHIEWHRKIVNK